MPTPTRYFSQATLTQMIWVAKATIGNFTKNQA